MRLQITKRLKHPSIFSESHFFDDSEDNIVGDEQRNVLNV